MEEKRGEAEKEVEHGEAAESSSEGDRGRKKTKQGIGLGPKMDRHDQVPPMAVPH